MPTPTATRWTNGATFGGGTKGRPPYARCFPFPFSKSIRRTRNEIVTCSRRLRSGSWANVGSSSRSVNGIVSTGGFFVFGYGH